VRRLALAAEAHINPWAAAGTLRASKPHHPIHSAYRHHDV